jgi:hypothetical protein
VVDLFGLACCTTLIATPTSSFSHWAANCLGPPTRAILPPPRTTRAEPGWGVCEIRGGVALDWRDAAEKGTGVALGGALPAPTPPVSGLVVAGRYSGIQACRRARTPRAPPRRLRQPGVQLAEEIAACGACTRAMRSFGMRRGERLLRVGERLLVQLLAGAQAGELDADIGSANPERRIIWRARSAIFTGSPMSST